MENENVAMQQRSALRVMWWGAALTAVAEPLLSLILATNLVMAPLVILDASAVTARIFWRWRDGPYRAAVLAGIGKRGELVTTILGLATGAIGIVGFALLTAFASAHLNMAPCLCAGPFHSLQFLLGSAVTAGLFSAMESAAMIAVVLAITKLMYDSQR